MNYKVSKVQINLPGIPATFKDPALGRILENECKKRARELDSTAKGLAHGGSSIHSELFKGDSKKLTNTYIGRVLPVSGTGKGGQNIAANINKEHNFIRW